MFYHLFMSFSVLITMKIIYEHHLCTLIISLFFTFFSFLAIQTAEVKQTVTLSLSRPSTTPRDNVVSKKRSHSSMHLPIEEEVI